MNQIDKMLNNIMGQKKKTNNKVLNNFGLKQFGGRNDLDFDGVLNKKDCQPRNTMRQDSKWKHVPTPAEPKHKTAYSESEPIRFKDIFSKNVYGDDGYAEVRGKYLDQNIKDNQEWAKKNALEKQEKAKKYPNVFSTRGTIRGQKKAGQLLDLKKSSLGVDYGQGEIFDDPYVGWRTRQAGETLRSLQNATIQKQQEWANKNEVQKDIQRITKEDTDGDNVPNEYDCEPQNKDKQGWAHSRSSFGREKTGQIKMMAPDKFLRTTYQEAKNKDENYNNSYEEYKQDVFKYPDAPSKIEKLKNVIRSKKGKMDVPFLLYDEQGRPTGHEGRHRAQAATELGVDLMPVMIAKKLRPKNYRDWKDRREQMGAKKDWRLELENEDKVSSSKSANIPIQEQREYKKEHPEVLQHVELKGAPVLGAPLDKQDEWKQKNEVEKDIDRISKADVDGDGTPNEYDCEPNNKDRQDTLENAKYVTLYHGTQKDRLQSIKEKGLLNKKKIIKQRWDALSPEEKEEYTGFNSFLTGYEDRGPIEGVSLTPSKRVAYQYAMYGPEEVNETIYNKLHNKKNTNPIILKVTIPKKKIHGVYGDTDETIKGRGLEIGTTGKILPKYIKEIKNIDKFKNEAIKEDIMFAKKRIDDGVLPDEEFDDYNISEKSKQQAFRHITNAPIHKQDEWKQKTEVQKDIDRITKEDTDGDNVPNEYDCEPENKYAQDTNQPEKYRTYYHGTTLDNYKKIKKEGLQPQQLKLDDELQRFKKNRKFVFLSTNPGNVEYYASVGNASEALHKSDIERKELERKKNIKIPTMWEIGKKQEYLKHMKDLGMDEFGVFYKYHNPNPVILEVKAPIKDTKRVSNAAFGPEDVVTQKNIPPQNIKILEDKELIKRKRKIEPETDEVSLGIYRNYQDPEYKGYTPSSEDDVDIVHAKEVLAERAKNIKLSMQKLSNNELLQQEQGATIHKQQEWKQKTEVQKDIQRITKEDTDGDNTPDEYDCEPNNKDKQDKAEVDYVAAGFKPVAAVGRDYVEYAKSIGLQVVPTSVPQSFHVVKSLNEPQLKKIQTWDKEAERLEAEGKPIEARRAASTITGEAYGYPKKAIEPISDDYEDNAVFKDRIQYEQAGHDTKDLDYLEYIPHGMTFEEAQQDALRRKQATQHSPPLPATHAVKWMVNQKTANPNLTYLQLEEQWQNVPKEERYKLAMAQYKGTPAGEKIQKKYKQK